jgi:hypothetical protein
MNTKVGASAPFIPFWKRTFQGCFDAGNLLPLAINVNCRSSAGK